MEDIMDEIIFNVTSQDSIASKKSFKDKSDTSVIERRKKKFTQKEIEELRKVYDKVVVNDYDDEYHMSEAERKKKFHYYETFSKITRCKKKYRKLDEYVKVYRLCMDALQIVANDNGVYPPDEFIRLVLNQKIKVYGLFFPRYIGKNKKRINWDYISEFIVDRSRDLSELSSDKNNDEDNKISIDTLFNDNELSLIREAIDNPDSDCMYDTDDEEDCYDDDENRKAVKKLYKKSPAVLRGMKDMIKKRKHSRRVNSALDNFLFNTMTQDDFEIIEAMDSKRLYKSKSDIPVFNGNIMSDKEFRKYLNKLDNYEREEIKVNYQGKMRTQAEIDEIEIKDALDKGGWNVRSLYKQKEKEAKLKKAYKKDKQREEELKKRLIRIQNRNKKRGSDSDIEFNCKKKKKKKKKEEGD